MKLSVKNNDLLVLRKDIRVDEVYGGIEFRSFMQVLEGQKIQVADFDNNEIISDNFTYSYEMLDENYYKNKK